MCKAFALASTSLAIAVSLIVTTAIPTAAAVQQFAYDARSDRPANADHSQRALVYNLNPLRSEKVKIEDKLVTPAAAQTTPTQGSNNKSTVTEAATCSARNVDPCIASLKAARDEANALARAFAAPEAQNVDEQAATALDSALREFRFDDKATTLDQRVDQYRTWLLAHVLASRGAPVNKTITDLYSQYDNAAVVATQQDVAKVIDDVAQATVGVTDPGKTRLSDMVDAVKTALKQLDNDSVKQVEAKAQAIGATWSALVKTQAVDPFYSLTSTQCTPEGFSSHTFTVSLLRGQDTIWSYSITCYPEFHAGAMYYADFLPTTTYALVVPPAGGNPVITKQRGDTNQGSIAAIVHWCPGDQGGNALCASIGGGTSNNNGLDLFIGGGVLFARRTFGIHGGARIGATTVLQDGFSVGQAVPAGTSNFTRRSTRISSFVGLTINTK